MNPKSNQRILWAFLAIAMVAVAALSLAKWLKQSLHDKPLQDYGAVPQFTLTDQRGNATTLATFTGHVWLADLIFTHCASVCPLMTQKMFELQKVTAEQPDVKIVSFSVDPTHDQPDTLAQYAAMHRADPSRWTFLTGPVSTIYTVIKTGFHLPVDSVGGDQTTPILHSPRFVLVDTKGHVRAYYNGLEDESKKIILHDIQALKEEATQ